MTDVTVNADGDVSSINEKRSWKDFLSAKNPFEGLAGKIKSVGSAALVSLDDWASGKNKPLAFLKQFEDDTGVSAHRVSTDRDFGVNEWNSVVFYVEPENGGDALEEHYIEFSHKNDALGYASALRMAVTDSSVMDAHESSILPPAASESFDHTESEPQVSEVSGPEHSYTDIHDIAAKMRRSKASNSAITAEEIDALLERDKVFLSVENSLSDDELDKEFDRLHDESLNDLNGDREFDESGFEPEEGIDPKTSPAKKGGFWSKFKAFFAGMIPTSLPGFLKRGQAEAAGALNQERAQRHQESDLPVIDSVVPGMFGDGPGGQKAEDAYERFLWRKEQRKVQGQSNGRTSAVNVDISDCAAGTGKAKSTPVVPHHGTVNLSSYMSLYARNSNIEVETLRQERVVREAAQVRFNGQAAWEIRKDVKQQERILDRAEAKDGRIHLSFSDGSGAYSVTTDFGNAAQEIADIINLNKDLARQARAAEGLHDPTVA